MYKLWLIKLRKRLWSPDSLIYLSALGVLSGISCAALILIFRYMIEAPSALWLPGNQPENFEALPSWMHFALPLAGAVVLGLIMSRMSSKNSRVGVVHVITRLHAHHGHLPLKNALIQFFGGAFAIATGQSGGREGPAIHLGAAANSLLGQQLKLPNNSIRMLVGCGAAAAIAASFNTPIAGVIFAMEVIMMEYSVAGFIPVMMAAFTGTVISRAVYGSDALFAIPVIEMASLWEIPFVLLVGVVTGCCAALFMVILKTSLRLSEVSLFKRLTLAGLITGCCALLAPEVMGIGYDTLNHALASELSLTLMLIIIAAKIVATAAGVGLGLPIGLVGPNLLIGALIGSVMGGIGAAYFPELSSNRSFYVLLGMGAMMGAVLNAPLAALMALLELSNNTSLIFPGMLAITAATLTTSEIFKQRSAQQTTLHSMKELLLNDPVSLALQRTSVASLMERNVIKSQPLVTRQQAEKLLSSKAHWVIFTLEGNQQRLASGIKLFEAISTALKEPIEELSLLDLCPHQALSGLHIQATLREALTRMNEREVDALLISGYIASPSPDTGIITRRDIVTYYTTPQKY